MSGHVSANRRCDPDERFIEAHDYDEKIPNWRRVQVYEVGNSKVIRCARCNRPATLLDCHWPWMTDATRCSKHSDFKAFPLED